MKTYLFYLGYILLLLITLGCSSSIDDEGSSSTERDTKEIIKIIEGEEKAWNNGDALSYSRNFDINGIFVNILGQYYIGHSEFLARHQRIFKEVFKGSLMHQKIVNLKFLDKDIVIVETIIEVSNFSNSHLIKGVYIDDKGFLKTRLLQILQRKENNWKIIAYHNTDIKKGVVIPE